MGSKKAAKKPPKLVAPGKARASSAGDTQRNTKSQPSITDPKRLAKLQRGAKHATRRDDAVILMRKLLATVGCKLFEVEADGNCLFRSIGDQLFGDQHQHPEIRKRIVDFIELKRDDFEPFMEDEEKFEHYCKRMREDGTWGGNQELYAAARLFQVYVVIHQESSRMVIECDALRPQRVVHVAYHGSDHYDSVRSLQDPCESGSIDEPSPPREIVLDCDGFRPEDLAKRWKVRESSASSQPHTDAQAASSIASANEAAVDEEDGDQQVVVRGIEGLQLESDSQALSKKELRKLKKAAKQSSAAPTRKKHAGVMQDN
ncbi:hypothetical protein PybrP1_010850 [[Pythium] brassicae (nom. inval.)]|nr:hypothetical protein PybrP1_010850 [[Pythium] brassicae (nom. inval.)]